MATTLTSANERYVPKKMEAVPCMLCGDKEYKIHELFGDQNQWRYVECKNCSNIYLNPRPAYNEEFTDVAYDQYAMDRDLVTLKGEVSPSTRKVIDRYKITLNELEKKYNKKGKILDLGCITGEFLIAAKECGWEPYGIDISKPMVDHINQTLKIPAKAGEFEHMDLSDWGKFDVIFCSHVIEHIPHPNTWMSTFKKYLKEDGILVLNIPNQMAPGSKLKRLSKKLKLRKPKWDHWRSPDHLYEPHIKSMKYLIDKNDFKLLDIYTYSNSEKEKQGALTKLFQKKLKWGSKLRLFAKLK